MGIVSGIVSFLLIWWVVIFCVLPWSLKRDETGKPDDPKLLKKALITTGISILVWLALYASVEMDIIHPREIAAAMMKEDYK